MNEILKDFKIKIEWTYYTGWSVKMLKMGCDVPVIEVNHCDINQAMVDAQLKLFEYLERESKINEQSRDKKNAKKE